MTIRLKTDGKKCLYEQIYEHIRREIKEGKLLAGERLPSTRSLAEYLQVARSTADYAYAQLLSEGYIEARPYKGYYVCPLEELLDLEGNLTENYAEDSRGKEPELQKPVQTHVSLEWESDIRFDFSPNGIDMTGFPFGIWKRITKNILNDSNSELFSQGEPQGDYDLSRAPRNGARTPEARGRPSAVPWGGGTSRGRRPIRGSFMKLARLPGWLVPGAARPARGQDWIQSSEKSLTSSVMCWRIFSSRRASSWRTRSRVIL